MGINLIELAVSFFAVILLVALVHFAAGNRIVRLRDEVEAREIARLLPGGFEVARIMLDADGRSALAADHRGRLLLVRPHGAKFVPLEVSREELRHVGGMVLVEPAGAPAIRLQLGSAAAIWAHG